MSRALTIRQIDGIEPVVYAVSKYGFMPPTRVVAYELVVLRLSEEISKVCASILRVSDELVFGLRAVKLFSIDI